MRVAIIVATYNTDISQGLLDGCLKALADCFVTPKHIDLYETDGAFECPLLAQEIGKHTDVDALICLGAVIKGDTAHFDYVAGPTALALQQVAITIGKPVIFGILTTYTYEQALQRCGDDENNKGYEAAITAVKTVQLLH